MRVDAGMSYQNMNQRPQPASNDSNAQASFADALSTVKADSAADKSTSEADFTSMTKKELFDWMNGELEAGRMTVEESGPFLALTLSARLTESGELIVEDTPDDTTHVNFVKVVNEGIEGAKSRNDDDSLEFLQLAKDVMERYQN